MDFGMMKVQAHSLQELEVLFHEADDGAMVLVADLLPLALVLQEVEQLDLAELALQTSGISESAHG